MTILCWILLGQYSLLLCSLLLLYCTVTVNNMWTYMDLLFFHFIFAVIIVSYVKLVIACISSLECRHTFWQTCGPHMSLLINFTIAMLFDIMYSRYSSNNLFEDLHHFIALEMVIVPPLLNPVIYGLKSKIRLWKSLKTMQ